MKEKFEVWDNFIKEQKYLENRSALMKAIYKARQPDEIVLRPRRTIYVRHPTTRKKIPMFRKGAYYEGHFYGGNRITIEVERQDWVGNCYQSSMTYGYGWHNTSQKKHFGHDIDTDKEITYIKAPWNKCDRDVRGVTEIHMDKDKLVNIIEANAGGASERAIGRILGNDSRVTVKGSGGQLVPIVGKRSTKVPSWMKRGKKVALTIEGSPLFEIMTFLLRESARLGRPLAVYISRDINPKKKITVSLPPGTPHEAMLKVLIQSNIKFRIKNRKFYVGAVGPWKPVEDAMVEWYGMERPSMERGDPDASAAAAADAAAAEQRASTAEKFKRAGEGRADVGVSQEKKESQYNNILKAAARKYRADAALIKAIINVESNFNPQKVGTDGQKGLMQLHPGLIKYLKALPYEVLGFEFANPMDPEQNIKAGAKYLQLLKKKFKSRNSTLVAWHAGPDAIKTGRLSEETRKWVNRVLKARNAYRVQD